MKTIVKIHTNWKAERRRQRFLNAQLEKLTNPYFLMLAEREHLNVYER